MTTPGLIPVTTPELLIVAIAELLLPQLDTLVVVVSVPELPAHNDEGPVMGAGGAFTVTVAIAMQPLGGVYVMTHVPGAMPLTTPVPMPTLAMVGHAQLHVPPEMP